VIKDGEQIVICEKIHGRNCRLGLTLDDSGGELFLIGTHNTRQKLDHGSIYQKPLDDNAKALLRDCLKNYSAKCVILFGELHGPKLQNLNYGKKEAEFAAFDISIDGNYLSHANFSFVCRSHNIQMVPVLGTEPLTLDVLKKRSSGSTVMMLENAHMREGIVFRPVADRFDPKIGRVILKYLNDDFLMKR
jgi:RNA ligase (TIGR02306 family)